MPEVKRIYVEKPVCSTVEEEEKIDQLTRSHPEKRIQVGFQYLFSTQIMGALSLWKTGKLGKPIHFEIKYYHGDYLRREYREKRVSRLTSAPDGGAMADLGSHIISIMIAFFGNRLQVVNTMQAGHFPDVQDDSDLFSLISISDPLTKAVGTISSSRISSGTGDLITFELYAEKGALKFTTHKPDCYQYYLEEEGIWRKCITGSNYPPFTSFPSGHVPPGWLRSMVHSHYVFLKEVETETVIPDIQHGLDVQRIMRAAVGKMKTFREQA
jgi:predicted dehydrogenase